MQLPDCFDCKYGGGEFPCRTAAGAYDFNKAGAAIVAVGRIYSGVEVRSAEDLPDVPDEIAWVTDCEYEIVQDHPQLLVPLIVAACDACETPSDAAFVAAGVIESSLVKHGPQLIGAIEAIAAKSPKFRYILSGVWSQGRSVDAGVWKRLAGAIGSSGRMSDDGRSAATADAGEELSEADVLELMKERVAASAAPLNLQV